MGTAAATDNALGDAAVVDVGVGSWEELLVGASAGGTMTFSGGRVAIGRLIVAGKTSG
ncbi:MAG: hypothetical protein HOK97_22040 [Deltaproteobacteria bacterium]|nr:hypothetical protein [Deltaproteobacteria bacterium]